MELTMTNSFGFCELNEQEMMMVDGGISWNDVGITVSGVAGGYIGGKIGAKVGAAIGTAIAPGAGTVIGTIVGAGVAVALYTFWD